MVADTRTFEIEVTLGEDNCFAVMFELVGYDERERVSAALGSAPFDAACNAATHAANREFETRRRRGEV